MIKILFLGDIVGRSGREAVHKYLPHIQKEHAIDATIINGENAAHGFGITKDICLDLFRLGVHVVTLGNHAWDNPDIVSWINQDKRIIRPTNFPKTHPGMGYTVVDLFSKGKVLVVNAQAQLFMHQHVDDPFAAVDNILRLHPLGVSVQGIVVDFTVKQRLKN